MTSKEHEQKMALNLVGNIATECIPLTILTSDNSMFPPLVILDSLLEKKRKRSLPQTWPPYWLEIPTFHVVFEVEQVSFRHNYSATSAFRITKLPTILKHQKKLIH